VIRARLAGAGSPASANHATPPATDSASPLVSRNTRTSTRRLAPRLVERSIRLDAISISGPRTLTSSRFVAVRLTSTVAGAFNPGRPPRRIARASAPGRPASAHRRATASASAWLERERPQLTERHHRRPIIEVREQRHRLARLLIADHEHRPAPRSAVISSGPTLDDRSSPRTIFARVWPAPPGPLRRGERQHRRSHRLAGRVQPLDHRPRQLDRLRRAAHDQAVRPPSASTRILGGFAAVHAPARRRICTQQAGIRLLLIDQQALDRPRDLARVRVLERERLDRGLLRIERLLVQRLDSSSTFFRSADAPVSSSALLPTAASTVTGPPAGSSIPGIAPVSVRATSLADANVSGTIFTVLRPTVAASVSSASINCSATSCTPSGRKR
jgi:hypothetical protein